MSKRITKMTLEQRPPASGRVEVRDADSPLVFRLTTAGARSFCVRTRLGSEQVRLTYPRAVTVDNLADARQWAHQAVEACKTGIDPRLRQQADEAAATREAERNARLKFEAVVARYLDRRVRREKKNRTADEVDRTFKIYVTPRWKHRLITEIRRRDVNDLIDDVYDKNIIVEGRRYGGQVAADRTLAQIRALFNWYATQDDEFISPIVTGMARTNSRERARSRVLSDIEIQTMWPLLSDFGTYGAIIKTLLLTAQRRDEVGQMARSEIDENGVWTIPASRYKTNRPNTVPLSLAAQSVIEEQDVINKSDLVFTLNGKTSFGGYSKAKTKLDQRLLAKLREAAIKRNEDPAKVALPDWRLHDLRRTAKTLMARAGIRPDISERVLGHQITGIEGVYDRHSYIEEKRAALERLAALIETIVKASPDVRTMREAAE